MRAIALTPPAGPLLGRVRVPGSKSLTNRALLVAALAGADDVPGISRLTGALKSQDTERMATALRAMGVTICEPDAESFEIHSDGRLRAPSRVLQLGNAGTAMRFLTAAATLADGPVTLDGDGAMRRRPIRALVTALEALGARSECATGCPPLTIVGAPGLRGGRTVIDASLSSQFVSAVLMAAPGANGPVEVALSGPDIGARGYVDLTLGVMKAFGVEASILEDGAWRLEPGRYRPTDFRIEPDASAATYVWAAERLTGGRIEIEAVSAAQPDARAFELIARYPKLPPVIDGSQMQDAVPTLAVLAAFNVTPVRFVGVANLRVKECDRLKALAAGLSQIRPGLGEEIGDDLLVTGDPDLAGSAVHALVETREDHRIAMSFSLAALKIHGVTILDPDCVAKTWPGWWAALGSLGVAQRVFELS